MLLIWRLQCWYAFGLFENFQFLIFCLECPHRRRMRVSGLGQGLNPWFVTMVLKLRLWHRRHKQIPGDASIVAKYGRMTTANSFVGLIPRCHRIKRAIFKKWRWRGTTCKRLWEQELLCKICSMRKSVQKLMKLKSSKPLLKICDAKTRFWSLSLCFYVSCYGYLSRLCRLPLVCTKLWNVLLELVMF